MKNWLLLLVFLASSLPAAANDKKVNLAEYPLMAKVTFNDSGCSGGGPMTTVTMPKTMNQGPVSPTYSTTVSDSHCFDQEEFQIDKTIYTTHLTGRGAGIIRGKVGGSFPARIEKGSRSDFIRIAGTDKHGKLNQEMFRIVGIRQLQ